MGKTITMRVAFKKPKGGKYPKDQLREGMKIEKEHTKNKKARKIISKEHLDEDKKYYTKLKKVEKKKGK